MLEKNRLELLGKILIVAGVASIAAAFFVFQTREPAQANVHDLAALQKRAYIKCGVASNLSGLSVINPQSMTGADAQLSAADQTLKLYSDAVGLEADLCRAVAVGLFGTVQDHLYFYAADGDWNSRMSRVVDGTIDILFRQAAIQAEMGSTHAVTHGPVAYFERIVLLTSNAFPTADAMGLSGNRICAIENSYSDSVARQYSQRRKREWVFPERFKPPLNLANYAQLFDALQHNQCDAIAGRFATLNTAMANSDAYSDYHIVPLSSSTPVPTVGVVSEDAYQLNQLASHVIWTLLRAEATGQTSDTVSPGFNARYWSLHGMDKDYPKRMIQQVGNYAEIYQRHFGASLPDAGPNTHYTLSTEGRLIAPK